MRNCEGQERGRGRKWRIYLTKNGKVKGKGKKCKNSREEGKMEEEDDRKGEEERGEKGKEGIRRGEQ